jgi:hypothetical protein
VPVVQPTFSSGFIGGVEGGLRYQLGKLVVGTEADITLRDICAEARRLRATR